MLCSRMIEFLNAYSEVCMILITAIYVVATLVICLVNCLSTKAAREELKEMKRQYDAENCPRIEYEFHYEQRTWYILRFTNHGRKTAYHVKILLSPEFIQSLPEQSFQEQLNKINGKECIIGVGQKYDVYIGSNDLRGNPNMKPLQGQIKYSWEDQERVSDFCIDLNHYLTFFSSTTEEEKMYNTVKDIEKDLSGIKNDLNLLVQHRGKGELKE